MKLHLIVIIFFTIIVSFDCIDIKKYCILPEEKSKNNAEFLETKCLENFGVQCGDKYCAVDQAACEQIHSILNALKLLNTFKYKVPMEKSENKYKKYLKNIVTCPNHAHKPVNSEDYCAMRQNSCRLIKKSVFKYGSIYIIKSYKCKCSESYIDCGRGRVCGKAKSSCDALKNLKPNVLHELERNDSYNFKDCVGRDSFS